MNEAELKLKLQLLETQKQLIEAHAQIMQYQHKELEAEIAILLEQLEKQDEIVHN